MVDPEITGGIIYITCQGTVRRRWKVLLVISLSAVMDGGWVGGWVDACL